MVDVAERGRPSDLVRGEQPKQLRLDAGEGGPGVGDGATDGGAAGAGASGGAPQIEQERAEAREIGLRPLARSCGRVRLAGARLLRVHAGPVQKATVDGGVRTRPWRAATAALTRRA